MLKKRWHGIPVALMSAVLAIVLIAGGALATVNLSETQTITQTIEEWNFGSITVAQSNPVLADVKVGFRYPNVQIGLVTVEVGSDGVDKYLHMKLNKESASLYDFYSVTLASTTNAMGEALNFNVQFGGEFPELLDASIQLTETGEYIFMGFVSAQAGSGGGTANVKVTYTLEDIP